jgi:hypothetical protein
MDAPAGSRQTNKGGTSGGVLAEFHSNVSRKITPASCNGPTTPRVCPGTSVILAPVVRVAPSSEAYRGSASGDLVESKNKSGNGALIYTTYGGVAELGPDVSKGFLAGNPTKAGSVADSHPVSYTWHPDYLWLNLWLNRLRCVGVGDVDMRQMRVSYDIYDLS